jgi:hypothetical protein
VSEVPGKLLKMVNGKNISDIVKRIIAVKVIIGIMMMILAKDYESEFVKELKWVET